MAAGLFMTSCKKEENKKTPANELLDKWKAEKTISSASVNGIMVESDTTVYTFPDYLTMEFKKDGRCAVTKNYGGELESANLFYKVEGDKLIVDEFENFPEPEIHTFQISGNKLQLLLSEKFEFSGDSVEYSTEIHLVK